MHWTQTNNLSCLALNLFLLGCHCQSHCRYTNLTHRRILTQFLCLAYNIFSYHVIGENQAAVHQFVRIVSARENNAINAKMKKDVVLYVGLGLTRYRGKEFWRNFFTIKLIKQSVSVVVTKKYVFYQYLENKLIIWNGWVYTSTTHVFYVHWAI